MLPPEVVAAVTEAASASPRSSSRCRAHVVESKPVEHGPPARRRLRVSPSRGSSSNAGKRHGVTREALAEAFTAWLEPQRVRMHHTYGLVDVPAERADEAVEALKGSELAGRTLNVELAREQPAAA